MSNLIEALHTEMDCRVRHVLGETLKREVESVVQDMDLEHMVESAIEETDLSSAVESAVDQAIEDADLDQKVEDAVSAAIDDRDLLTLEDVDKAVLASLDGRMDGFVTAVATRVLEVLDNRREARAVRAKALMEQARALQEEADRLLAEID